MQQDKAELNTQQLIDLINDAKIAAAIGRNLFAAIFAEIISF